MTTPTGPGDPPRVRTAVDAAVWLRHRSGHLLEQAAAVPSHPHAGALRLAASTLAVMSATVSEYRDNITAADELMRLAGEYREATTADLRGQDVADYQRACSHLGDALGEVGARLTHATAPERTRRTWVASYSTTPSGRDL